MSTYPRRQSNVGDTQPDTQDDKRQTPYMDSYMTSRSPVAAMRPPPHLDHWNNNNPFGPQFDSLLVPGTAEAPQTHERPAPTGTSEGTGNQSEHLQLPSIKDTDPLGRYYNDPAAPWDPQRVNSMAFNYGFAQRTPPNPRYDYRESPRSDVSASINGLDRHDSGYATRSYVSNSGSVDRLGQSQGCPSITGDLNGLDVNGGTSTSYAAGADFAQDDQSSSMDTTSDTSPRPRVPGSLTCEFSDCDHVSKNPSEAKKHRHRHVKPHKCALCAKPFSTHNDLERHEKSVHRIAPKNGNDRSFRCAALNCTKKDKIWPRLDNFRQHCQRIHKEENLDELVRKSSLEPRSQAYMTASEPIPQSPYGSRDQHVGWSEPGNTKFTNLAHISLSDENNPLVALGQQHQSHADIFTEPSNSNGQRGLPATQGFGQRGDEFNLSVMDHERPPTPSTPSRYQAQKTYTEPSSHLLQIPAVKRQRATENVQGHELPLSEKRRRLPAKTNMIHQASSERPTESQPRSSPETLQAIRDFVKDHEGTSDGITFKTRVLSLLGEGGEANTQTLKDTSSEFASKSKKKCIECDVCHKTMARQCDLKKHKKRHTRPYGCTFPACSKVFGSKNDWKRHENTRHYQIETWRCHETNSDSLINQCAKIFYRREQFQAHLKDAHSIKDDEVIKERCKKYRIGRNGQSGFWCGFCKQIITLKHKGLEAWDERFNHIDEQHFRHGQSIDDWYPLDKDIPIGALPNAAEPDSEEQNSPPNNEESGDEHCGEESPIDSTHPIQGDAGKPAGPKPIASESRATKLWYCVQ